MNQYQPINCQQEVQQYCDSMYDRNLYYSYADCINRRPCNPDQFAKCGDSFEKYIERFKKNFVKELGIRPDEINDYWDYTPAEEQQLYANWNLACEFNAELLHFQALRLKEGLNRPSFYLQLERASNGFTKYFTGDYPEEFFRTYETQTLPEAPALSSPTINQQNLEGSSKNNKIFLIVGAVILGIILLKK